MTKTNGQILYEAANKLRGLNREWCDNNEKEKAEFEYMAGTIALAEREACAQECEVMLPILDMQRERDSHECAAAIRERSNV